MAVVEDNPQISIEENVVEDADLERLLEERQTAKDKVGKARKAYKAVDEEAKVRVNALELGEERTRVGRFIISRREIAGRSVAFETGPSTRLWISVAKDDGTF